MEAIRMWLNSDRSYSAGVKLYLQFGDNIQLKRLFSAEDVTEFKKKKLSLSLEALLSEKKQTEIKAAVAKEKHVEKLQSERFFGKGWPADPDEVEKSLQSKWKPLFMEMMDLTSRLDSVARRGTNDPAAKIQAGIMALKILDLDDQCDAIYDQRDHYREHGRLPEQKTYGELCIDPKLIPLKLSNHRRYVREFKNRLAKNSSDTDAAEQLKKHEWFVEQYLKSLNQ